jgi:hypothetical protein
MSQDNDLPGFEVPGSEASATGGLPADFFEESTRIAAEPDGEVMPPSGGPLPPRRPATARPTRGVAGGPTILPVVGAVLLGAAVMFLSGVLTGWALARKDVTPSAPVAPPAPDPFAAAIARDVEAKASRAEVEAVTSAYASLARRVERLQSRVESQPTPDLTPLQTRLDELAKESQRLTPLPEALHTLDGHVGALDEAVGALRRDLASLREQSKAVAAPPPGPEPVGPGRGDDDVADRARMQGVELFEKREYARARDVFLGQAADTPGDARLWYYAALANGFATGDWRGETERLVRRGVECERAGTPGRAQIDALFADLAEERGGQWLREWRKLSSGR